MLLKKIDYINHKPIGCLCFTYFSSILILDLESDYIVWIDQTDKKEELEESDINISELYYYDSELINNEELQDNSNNDDLSPFFYDIDDDLFLEKNKSEYTKIYLSEIMRIN